ncbi:Ran BP2/NZF zinc finger-like superfamily protein [Abeliophyllum distichum]|uniref:Ran BP2/NZF zinc finger-like superfamily protein n=1 Tax=Abeliophyllum distichum TaxID=126358 RepID=A0ABD1UEP4_9LAMI
MILQRTVRDHRFHKLFKFQSPSLYFKNRNHFSFLSLIFERPFSVLAHFQHKGSGNCEEKSQKDKERLSVYFKQAVGLSGEIRNSVCEVESDIENAELNKRLKKLEEQVRGLNEEKPREILNTKTPSLDGVSRNEVNSSLYALFANNGVKKNEKSGELYVYGIEDPSVYKKLSPDMELFVYHLYKDGYFKDSNFLLKNKFDLNCFENSYAREFIKYAAVSFGKDNQEIAKWLSASDLKKVALFGCPSLGKKTVFSAKRLRGFFNIQENTVCNKCPLKMSCKLVNKTDLKGDNKNLHLADVMKVIIMYAMESIPPKLTLSNEIKDSVSRLLKEIVRLSCNVS